jgi:hypothetical protein
LFRILFCCFSENAKTTRRRSISIHPPSRRAKTFLSLLAQKLKSESPVDFLSLSTYFTADLTGRQNGERFRFRFIPCCCRIRNDKMRPHFVGAEDRKILRCINFYRSSSAKRRIDKEHIVLFSFACPDIPQKIRYHLKNICARN